MSKVNIETPTPEKGANCLRTIVATDKAAGRYGGRVMTRFPPEPNGYPHIGHAKSICLNFGLAAEFGGVCNLRMDDTNPSTEDVEYVAAILRDVRWLGFEFDQRLYYASDYYEKLYEFARVLIRKGSAYVCDLSEDQIREYRGTVAEPGRPSPWRERSVEENLDLFGQMRNGEFPDGSRVLRAKIDMGNANMKMRDPLLYRIRHAHHYRTGDAWCIYPFYDFAHCLSDAIEGITHSICTLEFENNRELYDWILAEVGIVDPPRQYEFARLSLNYTVMSKRKLLQLVEEGLVSGWDDPRMPTLSAQRRRGVTPESLRNFAETIGVAKANSTVEMAVLEHCIRDDLNMRAPRVMAVLDPVEVVIENWPEDQVEWLDASYWPKDVPREGSRKVPFSGRLYIDREDFVETPPPGYHRLAPGREVRLRYGYFITCTGVDKDKDGAVVRVRCTYDPATRGGDGPRSPKGTLHWVSAAHALPCEVRLYERLFTSPEPGADSGDFKKDLNPDSLVVRAGALVEPSVGDDPFDTRYQFERLGYFWRDPTDGRGDRMVFNRIVALKDGFARQVAASPPKVAVSAPATPAPVGARPALSEASEAVVSALMSTHGLAREEAVVLAGDAPRLAFFEAAVTGHGNPRAIASWLVHVLPGLTPELAGLPFGPAALAGLVAMVDEGLLSSTLAKELLSVLVAEGGDPRQIAASRGLLQVSDTGAIDAAIDAVLAANADSVEKYRAGKTNVMGFLVGQVMKQMGGKANPKLATDRIKARLG